MIRNLLSEMSSKRSLLKIDVSMNIPGSARSSSASLPEVPSETITPSSSSDSLPQLPDDSAPRRKPRPKPINLGQIAPKATDSEASKKETRRREESIVEFVQDQISDSDLETLEELGMGNGGTVFRVLHKGTNTIMAKKVIHQLTDKIGGEILKELQVLKKAHSPYIVSFYGAFQSEGEICICMEYMDVGSLEKIGKVSGRLGEDILTIVTVSVLKGLVYLYENLRIIHRDIKPSNVLVNSQGKIKLCDFGVSGQVENSVANTFVGTGAYMSPERIQGSKYSSRSDVWALGMTILELAIGRYPFYPPPENEEEPVDQMPYSEFELLSHIINDPVPDLPSNFSEAFKSFIADSLIKDPAKRPTPAYLLANHPLSKNEQSVKLDLAAWARSFLNPNLNEQQKNRLSVSLAHKRQSIVMLKEKRKSMANVKILSPALENKLSLMSLKDKTSVSRKK